MFDLYCSLYNSLDNKKLNCLIKYYKKINIAKSISFENNVK